MEDPFAALKEIFDVISPKLEDIGTLIQKTNETLARIDPRIEVWLDDKPLVVGKYKNEQRCADNEWRSWQEAIVIGYCLIGDTDTWELAIREVNIEWIRDDWDRLCNVVSSRDRLPALREASDKLQKKAFYLIPEVLQLLNMKGQMLLKILEIHGAFVED